MSDRNHSVGMAETHVQSPTDAKDSERRWSDEPSIRMYGSSPGITALQIRGKTRSGRPAFAHASLDDTALMWLYAVIKERIKDRGLRVKDAPALDEVPQ